MPGSENKWFFWGEDHKKPSDPLGPWRVILFAVTSSVNSSLVDTNISCTLWSYTFFQLLSDITNFVYIWKSPWNLWTMWAERLPEIERGNPWNLRTGKNGHNSRIWLFSTCGNSPEVKRCDVPISASRWGVMDSQMEPLASPLALDAEVEKTLFNAGSSQLASFLGGGRGIDIQL